MLCAKRITAQPYRGSHPPPHPLDIIIIRRAELAPHLGFLEGDVDPVGGGEHREGYYQHRPGADPHGDAEGDGHEAKIHRVAGEAIGTVGDQGAIGR